jgi:hypothetical protein
MPKIFLHASLDNMDQLLPADLQRLLFSEGLNIEIFVWVYF